MLKYREVFATAAAAAIIIGICIPSHFYSTGVLLVAAAILMFYAPLCIRYFEVYIHEMFHGFFALFCDGRWSRFMVSKDLSGLCWAGGHGALRQLIIFSGGYIGVVLLGTFLIVASSFPPILPLAILVFILLIGFSLTRVGGAFTSFLGLSLVGIALMCWLLPGSHVTVRILGVMLVAMGFDSIVGAYHFPSEQSDMARIGQILGINNIASTTIFLGIGMFITVVGLIIVNKLEHIG